MQETEGTHTLKDVGRIERQSNIFKLSRNYLRVVDATVTNHQHVESRYSFRNDE